MCCCSENGQKKPVVLFTKKPDFDLNRTKTPRSKPRRDELIEAIKNYRIDMKEVVFIPTNTTDNCFTRESFDLVRKYFEIVGVPPHSVVYTDNAKIYKNSAGDDVFLTAGFAEHRYFIPAIHGVQNVCDGSWNGPAKRKWNEEIENKTIDIDSSFKLKNCLAERDSHALKRYCERVMMREIKTPTLTNCKLLFDAKLTTEKSK